MLNNILFFVGIALCVLVAICFISALIAFINKKPKAECISGVMALIATIISFTIYYYLRIILSGGTLLTANVIPIVIVYLFSLVLGIVVFLDGKRKIQHQNATKSGNIA